MPAVVCIQQRGDDIIFRIINESRLQDEILAVIPDPVETSDVNLNETGYVDRNNVEVRPAAEQLFEFGPACRRHVSIDDDQTQELTGPLICKRGKRYCLE